MSVLALQVQQLGKRYRIGGRAEPFGSLRESLMRATAAPRRILRRGPDARVSASTVWALRDVSFEVKHGEVLGIIGRNGAGKSTLLKILSRITEPTRGRVAVWGRVGSLLEVGTGFHPELTGRENIFLNGAILGMTRTEIKRRFDEIVDFSGIERFLDTPVKRYSSGMYMRLAFAVAAHLDPEILIVDEVLAVGDAEFQKKCLHKMSEVAGEGRTVLFVSHNLAAVESLCHRVILLDGGTVACNATPLEAVAAYRSSSQQVPNAASVDLSNAPGRRPDLQSVLKRVELRDGLGNPTSSVECGQTLAIKLWYEHTSDIHSPNFAIKVETAHGVPLIHMPSQTVGKIVSRVSKYGSAVCTINSLQLVPGHYRLAIGCRAGVEQLDLIEEAITFTVDPTDYYGTGNLPDMANGPCLAQGSWTLDEAANRLQVRASEQDGEE